LLPHYFPQKCSWLFSIEIDHAFQKKTQKTPKKEIKLAERRKQEFIKRE